MNIGPCECLFQKNCTVQCCTYILPAVYYTLYTGTEAWQADPTAPALLLGEHAGGAGSHPCQAAQPFADFL